MSRAAEKEKPVTYLASLSVAVSCVLPLSNPRGFPIRKTASLEMRRWDCHSRCSLMVPSSDSIFCDTDKAFISSQDCDVCYQPAFLSGTGTLISTHQQRSFKDVPELRDQMPQKGKDIREAKNRSRISSHPHASSSLRGRSNQKLGESIRTRCLSRTYICLKPASARESK